MKSIPNPQPLDSSNKLSSKNSLHIKYGRNYYEIPIDHIAYIYKKEGVFFIANKNKVKVPIFIENFDEIVEELTSNNFFKLDDYIYLSKGSVRMEQRKEQCIAIAYNESYEDAFFIPKEIENKVKKWISA